MGWSTLFSHGKHQSREMPVGVTVHWMHNSWHFQYCRNCLQWFLCNSICFPKKIVLSWSWRLIPMYQALQIHASMKVYFARCFVKNKTKVLLMLLGLLQHNRFWREPNWTANQVVWVLLMVQLWKCGLRESVSWPAVLYHRVNIIGGKRWIPLPPFQDIVLTALCWTLFPLLMEYDVFESQSSEAEKKYKPVFPFINKLFY